MSASVGITILLKTPSGCVMYVCVDTCVCGRGGLGMCPERLCPHSDLKVPSGSGEIFFLLLLSSSSEK